MPATPRGSFVESDEPGATEAQQQAQASILEKIQSCRILDDVAAGKKAEKQVVLGGTTLDVRQLLYHEISDSSPSPVLSKHKELRLIFLDCDGVLNCLKDRTQKIIPEKLALIGHICAEAGAQIELVERLYQLIIILFSAVGFGIGYVKADFRYTFYIWLAGMCISIILCTPDWPWFNRNPVSWLPSIPERVEKEKEQAAKGKQKDSKKKK
eukprot:g506.t1